MFLFPPQSRFLFLFLFLALTLSALRVCFYLYSCVFLSLSLSIYLCVCVSLSASHSLASHISPPAFLHQWNRWKSRLIKRPKWFSALKPRKPHLQIQRKQVRLLYFLSSLPYSLILYSNHLLSTQLNSFLHYSIQSITLVLYSFMFSTTLSKLIFFFAASHHVVLLCYDFVRCILFHVYYAHAADFICSWSRYALNLIWSLYPKSYLELQWRPVFSFLIAI